MSKRPKETGEPESLEHLLAVSTTLFAERGLNGVSIGEISRESKVSVSAIYYHFHSKEELFGEVCLRKYEDFEHEVFKRLTEVPQEQLTAVEVVLAFFDVLILDSDLLRILQRDLVPGSSPNAMVRSRQSYHRLKSIIDLGLGFDTSTPEGELRFLSVAAIINGYADLVIAGSDESPLGREEYIARNRAFLALFIAGIFNINPNPIQPTNP